MHTTLSWVVMMCKGNALTYRRAFLRSSKDETVFGVSQVNKLSSLLVASFQSQDSTSPLGFSVVLCWFSCSAFLCELPPNLAPAFSPSPPLLLPCTSPYCVLYCVMYCVLSCWLQVRRCLRELPNSEAVVEALLYWVLLYFSALYCIMYCVLHCIVNCR